MYSRDLKATLLKYTNFPAIALLGPRQSGKTTLVRETFPQYTYVTLEHEPTRSFAEEDPEGFLQTYDNDHGLIIDEFQYVPKITSYLQLLIDEKNRPGHFILTGSQNFLANKAINQSLAGRIGILNLLPLSLHELSENKILKKELNSTLFYGGYPRIFSSNINPEAFYPSYIKTYIEKDVRQLASVGDLRQFNQFLQLCAGRVGHLLNINALGEDAGISFHKAKSWLSILETSYIIFLLEPHSKKFSKRLTKSPKIFFYDVGLLCSLLRITNSEMLIAHPLRGNIFESFVVADLVKQFVNIGLRPSVSFWRDRNGLHEIDCIIDKGAQHFPIEIKSGMTIGSDFFKHLNYWNEISKTPPENNYIIYGGEKNQKRTQGSVLGWKSCGTLVPSLINP